MKYLFSLTLFLSVFLSSQILNAEVYSKVNTKSLITGTSDCWIINYTLWNSMGTTDPSDDVAKGTYNALVGTDCPTPTPFTEFEYEKSTFGVLDQEIGTDKISVYPNPGSDEILVSFKSELMKEGKWTWSLISFDNVKYLSGEQFGNVDFTISTHSLKSGNYLLLLVNSNNEIQYSNISIIN